MNSRKPKVSVIIPAFKANDFISESLQSVFNQTFDDYEIIVVNDGSPDTVEFERILEPFLSRIIYLKQKNCGAAAARNKAIKAASGEILAFLDHDDIWDPEYLESQLRVRSEKQCDLIYCDALLFGSGVAKNRAYSIKAPSSGKVTTESLIDASCNVITSGTMVSRQAVIDFGLFDENLPGEGFEDFDLWFRLAKGGVKLDYHRDVLLKHRIHSDNLSGGPVKIAERDVIALDVIQQKHDLNDQEKEAINARRVLASASLDLELAKSFLVHDNFESSIEYFIKAHKYYNSLKLRLVIFFFSITPQIAQRVLRTIRPKMFN